MSRTVPGWRSVSGRLPCSPEQAWALLTDTDAWPRWGPTVVAARLDGPFTSGTPGTVTTLAGVEVPVVLRDVVPGERWTWDVHGVRATSHEVAVADDGSTVVTFGVPPWALPYLAVCTIALGRLARLADDGLEQSSD